MKKTGTKWCRFDFGAEPKQQSKPKPVGTTKLKNSKLKTTTNKKHCDVNFNAALTPQIPADLAVHSKKIKEIEIWLENNIIKRPQNRTTTSLLVLSGPTGAGKTATINVLCKNSKIRITEWINPMDHDFDIVYGQNQIERFREFLIESKWNSIFCDNNDKRLILIEEFPNAVLRKPEEFHNILEEISCKNGYPVVFICTDICNDKGITLMQSLFPQEILNRFNITQIHFNSCAPTLMKCALKRAQNFIEMNRDSFKIPTNSTIDAIITTSNGDIRSAINQFYFASLLGCDELPIENQTIDKNRKRKRNNMITKVKTMQRDENLGLFHSLGRVLNPKRIINETDNIWRLDCNLDKLIDEFSIKPQLFINFLHENYLKYFGDLNDVNQAAEWLSYSQIFLDKWTGREDTVMFSLWITVLGLMTTNQHRLSQWTQIRAPTKLKISTNNDDENTRNLSPTDLYYYNIIKNKKATYTANSMTIN